MKRDYILLGLFGLVGLIIFLTLYRYADPSANIKLTKSKAEIISIGTKFLKNQGFELSGYKSSQVFSGDNFAAIFIQKEVGLDSLNNLAQPEKKDFVPLWYWKLRWFKPQQKEEFRLSIATNGKLIGFQHLLREDAPGDTISTDSARVLAIGFLSDKFGWDNNDWTLISSKSEDKKERRDHSFTWKSKTLQIGDGELRIEVKISGNEVSGFSYYLKVPEPFKRSYLSESSVGTLIAGVSFFLSILLFTLGIFFVVRGLIRGQPNIKISLTAVIPLFIAGLFTVINTFPLRIFSYSTETQYASFLFFLVFSAILLAIGISALGGFSILAGYFLSYNDERKRFFVGLLEMSYGNFLNPHWFKVVILGYLIAFIFLGSDVIIYLLGRKVMGVWFPAGNRFTEGFGTLLPILYPLSVSLIAGFWEETFYRLAGFTILRRLRLPLYLAILLPTLLWAFAHSNYPVFPVWFRGVELTLGGLLFFLFFYWYGLLTVIFAHFMIDTIYMALPLISAPVFSLKAQGIIALSIGILPVILGILSKSKRFFIPPELSKLNPDHLKELLLELIHLKNLDINTLTKLAKLHGITKNHDVFYFILKEFLKVDVTWQIVNGFVYMQVPDTSFIKELAETLKLPILQRENTLLVKYSYLSST